MAETTIPRVELPKGGGQIPARPVGHWIAAGTPCDQPYPCTCWYSPCTYERCPDRYRTEGGALPDGCCGRGSPVAGKTPKEALEYWVGVGGYPKSGKPREKTLSTPGGFKPRDQRTTWEKRLPTAPGAPVADSDLWADGLDDAPPAWDAIDEVSPDHGDELEEPSGYSVPPAAPDGERSEAEERWHAELGRRQAVVVAGHCDCATPWDVDAPLLLLAKTKTGPVETTWSLPDRPGIDVRAEAELRLREHPLGLRPLRAWKDGRHGLLPPTDPGSRTKTRPGWLAPLADGAWAVIDVPDAPRGGGVHCPDCHRDFGNAGAFQAHRPGRGRGCVDPASVRLVRHVRLAPGASTTGPSGSMQIDHVEYGPQLLKRTLAGVWSIDPLAVWPDGPPMTPEAAMALWRQAQDRLAAAPRWRFGRGQNRAA